ncbi:PF06147 family protein [Staphylococcus epidermidis VCU111]|uniref:putative HNHc nuclease n=1 Tax=Staphylococcus epidermidis TaxID=1282 RepID=UPI0004A8E571|nr:putative HNHc nuclease [Staphylococcus epidermidis]KDP68571.1 PF06147 family protein [Staphylococcus epidermidis VCU111]MDK7863530.1 putative HNHc nuclease [Staphylococcus epidermidis]MDK8302691.1 putative HNHc nuclease [Staphylococcus epidermidis]MDK8326660.1 putative HNHc nuclease [Staphylococcus epidermidis]
MVVIKNYITEDDGTTTVVIKGVELDNKTSLLLDNGYEVEADVRVVDPFKITDKQRRKIFALCNDIEAYTGQPRDYMRYLFMDYVEVLYGYEKPLSLSDCTREQAKQVIEVILDWVFHNNIPLNYKTSDLLKNDKAFLYWSTVNRNCVICGNPHSDLAHRFAVGRGRDRTKINHFGNQVLALCRSHHNEQHQIGMDTFNNKYHLTDSWVDVDERLNKMLKGAKNEFESNN